jgi:hypothetical protein
MLTYNQDNKNKVFLLTLHPYYITHIFIVNTKIDFFNNLLNIYIIHYFKYFDKHKQ